MHHPDFLIRLLFVWLASNVAILVYFLVLHCVYNFKEKRSVAAQLHAWDRVKRRGPALVIDRYPSLDRTANSGTKT